MSRFIKSSPELQTKWNRKFHSQRARCEDPVEIAAWFKLVEETRQTYGILDSDIYNFDETGFMMGQICPSMVVTASERRARPKAIQPGNREWATAIVGVNALGEAIPPFLILKARNHLSSWYKDDDLS